MSVIKLDDAVGVKALFPCFGNAMLVASMPSTLFSSNIDYDAMNVERVPINEDAVVFSTLSLRQSLALYSRAIVESRNELKFHIVAVGEYSTAFLTKIQIGFDTNMKFESWDFEPVVRLHEINKDPRIYEFVCSHTNHEYCFCHFSRFSGRSVDCMLSNKTIRDLNLMDMLNSKFPVKEIGSGAVFRPHVAVSKVNATTYSTEGMAREYVAQSYVERKSDITTILKTLLPKGATVCAPHDGAGPCFAACKDLNIICKSSDISQVMVDIAREKGNDVVVSDARSFVSKHPSSVVFISHSEQFDPGVAEYVLTLGRQVIVYESGCEFFSKSRLHENYSSVWSTFPRKIPFRLHHVYRARRPPGFNTFRLLLREEKVSVNEDIALTVKEMGKFIRSISSTDIATREACKSVGIICPVKCGADYVKAYTSETELVMGKRYYNIREGVSHTTGVWRIGNYYFGLYRKPFLYFHNDTGNSVFYGYCPEELKFSDDLTSYQLGSESRIVTWKIYPPALEADNGSRSKLSLITIDMKGPVKCPVVPSSPSLIAHLIQEYSSVKSLMVDRYKYRIKPGSAKSGALLTSW